MRRVALSTLAVALTLGTASLAAAQQPQQPQAQQQPQQQWGQRGQRWQRGQRGRRALFRGVNLTSQQKDQIKAINQKYAQQARPIREALRPVMQQIRTDRQKGDSTAARAAFEQTRSQREQLRSLREQELKDIRAVLTPDQQKTFDQNVAQLKSRMEQWQRNRQNRQGRARQGA